MFYSSGIPSRTIHQLLSPNEIEFIKRQSNARNLHLMRREWMNQERQLAETYRHSKRPSTYCPKVYSNEFNLN